MLGPNEHSVVMESLSSIETEVEKAANLNTGSRGRCARNKKMAQRRQEETCTYSSDVLGKTNRSRPRTKRVMAGERRRLSARNELRNVFKFCRVVWCNERDRNLKGNWIAVEEGNDAEAATRVCRKCVGAQDPFLM